MLGSVLPTHRAYHRTRTCTKSIGVPHPAHRHAGAAIDLAAYLHGSAVKSTATASSLRLRAREGCVNLKRRDPTLTM